MNKFDIANGLIFKALELNIDSLDNRIIAQKKIFLLQELGVKLGYSYNWYLHGPYSPDLTSYLYDNLEIFYNGFDFNGYACTEKVNEDINKVNELGNNIPKEFDRVSWYELLASLLYLYKRDGLRDKKLFKTLTVYKPQYDEKQCKIAFAKLTDWLKRDSVV